MGQGGDSYREVRKVLFSVLVLNLAVAGAKITWGRLTRLLSLQADGFHSLLDGASSIIGLIAVWVAAYPPDETHPYGHTKFETIASFFISVLLFLTCFTMLKESYGRLQKMDAPETTGMSLFVILITLVVNLIVTSWEKTKGKELQSEILMADALHTQSDLFSSLSVLVSWSASRLGYPLVDPIATLLIAGLIGKTGYRILEESSKVLTDYSWINPKVIQDLVMKIEGVYECHTVRTRGRQNFIYVDLHIHVHPGLETEQAHSLAHRVEAEIKKKFTKVVEVIVHVEPHLPQEGHH